MRTLQIHYSRLLATVIISLCVSSLGYSQSPIKKRRPTTQQQALTAQEIARKTLPSVVLLVTEDTSGKLESLGSGFFVRDDVIATNYHVIENASRIRAKIVGQKAVYDVVGFVGIDKERDLALLKVFEVKARPLVLGNSHQISVGDEVYAVSNPEGFEGTFSQGIISGIRLFEGKRFIQITAPVSHGSSGGAVLNKRGEVIGVAVSTIESGQNLNFAIPVLYLSSMINETKLNRITVPKEWFERDMKPIQESDVKDAPPDVEMSAEEHYKLGASYFSQAKYEQAVEEYKLATILKKEYVEAYCGLGEAYLRMSYGGTLKQEANKALDAYKNAIRIKPNYAEAHLGLGISYLVLARYEEAIEAAEQAIRIKPDNSKAHLVLGICYSHLAEAAESRVDQILNSRSLVEKAKYYLVKATLIDPKNFDGYSWLGKTYRMENRYDEELATYKKALQVFLDSPELADDFSSTFTVYNCLSRFYQSSGRLSEGIETFKQIIKLRPKDGRAYLNLGELYVYAKDKSSALKVYEELKRIDWLNASLLFALIYK